MDTSYILQVKVKFIISKLHVAIYISRPLVEYCCRYFGILIWHSNVENASSSSIIPTKTGIFGSRNQTGACLGHGDKLTLTWPGHLSLGSCHLKESANLPFNKPP